MSKVFAARFSIIGAGPLVTPGDFEVFASVIDSSLDGYSVSDVTTGDLFFDENLMNGQHTRYQVLSVVGTGSGAFGGAGANSIHLNSRFADEGVYDPSGPAAGEGLICKPTSLGISELPAWTIQGLSESLVTRARNIDMRKVIDPAIVAGGGGSASFVKSMKNTSGVSIPAGTPVAKKSDGGITASKSDDPTAVQYIGITSVTIADAAFGDVNVPWPNIAGVLTGKGFASGDNVYMSENTGAYAKDPSDFTGSNDRIIKVGIADCTSGVLSGVATDLLMFTQVIGKF